MWARTHTYMKYSACNFRGFIQWKAMNEYPWKIGVSKLKIHQMLANSFCKEPVSWYFHLCRLCGLSPRYLPLQLQRESSH